MGINWESGNIDDEQHILRPEQVHELVCAMNDGEEAYIDSDDLGVDIDGKLWVGGNACAFSKEEVEELDEFMAVCRVIKSPAGFIVDASTGDFSLEKSRQFKFTPDYRLDPEKENWIEVVGLIETEEQRLKAGEILFLNFGIMLGASALSEIEVSDED